MKSIICLTIGIALSCLASAIAQEETPPPEEDPTIETSTPAATPMTTPMVTPMTTPMVTPESSPMTTPAEKKPASSTAEKKKEPAAGQKKESATKPVATEAKPGKKMSVEATLKDMENKWEAAYASHSSAVAQSMVSDDFIEVYWDGKVMRKSNLISEIKKDKDTYKSAVNEKLVVHQYASNVAVVVGTAREKGTAKDGKAFDRTFRFTDTWVERNGQWQCVASQVMKVRG